MILTRNSAVASLMLSRFLYFEDMNDIDKLHFLFPIKEPFRAQQLAKILIQ